MKKLICLLSLLTLFNLSASTIQEGLGQYFNELVDGNKVAYASLYTEEGDEAGTLRITQFRNEQMSYGVAVLNSTYTAEDYTEYGVPVHLDYLEVKPYSSNYIIKKKGAAAWPFMKKRSLDFLVTKDGELLAVKVVFSKELLPEFSRPFTKWLYLNK